MLRRLRGGLFFNRFKRVSTRLDAARPRPRVSRRNEKGIDIHQPELTRNYRVDVSQMIGDLRFPVFQTQHGWPITPARARPALRAAPGTDCQGVSVDPPRCAREGWRARRACWRAATRRRRAGWASPRLSAWIPPWRTRRGASTRRGTPRGGRSPRAGAWRASPISTCARLKNGWCPRTARKVRRRRSRVPLSSTPRPAPRRARDVARFFQP